MKLKIGEPSYPFSFMGPIWEASIRGVKKGRDLRVIVISIEEMSKLRAQLPHIRGLPTRVAYDEKNKKLWLHPCPNAELELDIRGARQRLSLPKK